MVEGTTSRPFSAAALPPFAIASHEDNHDEVIQLSRKMYSRPRAEVEREIAQWSGMNVDVKSSFDRGREKRDDGRERPFSERKRGRETFKYASHLEDLGIEFAPFKKKTFWAEEPKEAVKETPAEEKAPEKYLSLGELSPAEKTTKIEKERHQPKTPNIDVEELKEALKKALGDAGN
jgi:hypothetical protein